MGQRQAQLNCEKSVLKYFQSVKVTVIFFRESDTSGTGEDNSSWFYALTIKLVTGFHFNVLILFSIL